MEVTKETLPYPDAPRRSVAMAMFISLVSQLLVFKIL